MRTPHVLATALLVASSAAFAAPAEYLFVDDSSPDLISTAAALAVWKAQVADGNMRMRLQKLYPVSKWGFVSQVQGGFTREGACVVTARAVMVPRVMGSRLVFKPQHSATAFGSQPGATREQCRELAAAKLKDAILGVRSVLIADR
ncbi:MAG: hypothetical protein K8R60_20935 [Burkholderiales bacterium]|nr:hypothetical protein [Burkholderiales bacterium]